MDLFIPNMHYLEKDQHICRLMELDEDESVEQLMEWDDELLDDQFMFPEWEWVVENAEEALF
jgi:hypothetical protein